MSSRRASAAALKTRASVFAALGDTTRLSVLGRLAAGEPQSIARPVARLSARGLIEDTPEGSRATDLGMRFLNDLLLEFMPERAEMPGAFALSIGPAGPRRQSAGSLFTGANGSNAE